MISMFCFQLIGKETVHQMFGTRVAVLAGDFMFAQSSWYLANLENIEVIKLISQVSSIIIQLCKYPYHSLASAKSSFQDSTVAGEYERTYVRIGQPLKWISIISRDWALHLHAGLFWSNEKNQYFGSA